MATHKHIDKLCLAAVILSLILCAVFMNGEALGIQMVSRGTAYEDSLFDTSKVHTIDIVIDDWEAFLETAQSETYTVCSVVIDGEAVKNVGIRGKGNTSLSSVARMNSDRYSFKIEFDQYDSTKNYQGLDKLCLNNIIQDNIYMKDYLSYQMMLEFGVDAPLCSYAYLTVNGEDWGLYLAVEAVEDSFLQRNYGSGYGELYKPDSMSMGGGRGNGKDFNFSDLPEMQENGGRNPTGGMRPDKTQGDRFNQAGMTPPENFDPANGSINEMPMPGNMGGGFGGMGSSDVKLQYIDDDPDSYANIFDNAKTEVSEADQKRLIASLKQLSAYENLDEVVAIDEVLRYFVVHNFVVNGDSYTGSMIHNYYLYEENGTLSMIPWDYNLAFGTFQGGNANSVVNAEIDEVLSDRPMQAWIFSNETYRQQYYDLYAQLLERVDIQSIIDSAYELIVSYVEKDPTRFCTYEEFEAGVEALRTFCSLRTQSVEAQLAGEESDVDASSLTLSDMGTMGNSVGGGKDQMPELPGNATPPNSDSAPPSDNGTQTPAFPDNNSAAGSPNSGRPQFPGFGGQEGQGNPSPDQKDWNQGAIPDWEQAGGSSQQGGNQWVLLLASVVILAAGLLAAFKFKH